MSRERPDLSPRLSLLACVGLLLLGTSLTSSAEPPSGKGKAPPPAAMAQGRGAPPARGSASTATPTGLVLQLENARPGNRRYSVRLEGVSDPAGAQRVTEQLPALETAAPALLRALRGAEALPLPPTGQLTLSPLPPFRMLRVRLVTEAGLESAPVEVPLREGELVPVALDVARLFAGGEAGLVDLRGRVQVGDTSSLPAGTTLERLDARGAPGRARQELAADGAFTFKGLPSDRPSRFRVRLPRAGSGRALHPSHFDFTFSPTGAGEPAEVLWRVPLHRWLTLKLDATARSLLDAATDPAYPVFVLQRQEAGAWRTQPAEEFARGAGQVDISLLQPGTYRVIAAASPYLLYESQAVEVGEQQRQAVVTFRALAPGTPCEVRVTSASTGRPLAGASLALAGPHPSLPPVRGVTDAQGRLRLGPVHTRVLHLEFEHAGDEPLAQDIAGQCLQSGVADVRVPG